MAITQPDIILINKCGELLIKHGLTIAFAESATCGRIAAEYAMAINAGEFLKGGIACYDACVKENLLNVDHALIQKYTPESAAVTKAITLGLSKLFDADILVGCTGLTKAGGSESIEKPVGTMFFYGLAHHKEIFSERVVLEGTSEELTCKAVDYVTQTLINYLNTTE